ncbi:hypothetical protein [Herpetosiphon giganteus]|uniref:hypothetical protein n=1 Tax=Herpetosiphon giganteus TaxID=2029754 RepID=UPI00195BD59D|nr:hypothetical protein [Herpetosiphon giganteus]MBM7842767.1 hypothetical protein [Herpetosiphon giganteus]
MSDLEHLQSLVEDAFMEAPLMYTNGFINGLGSTDAYTVLQTNGRAVAVVNMSLPVAKTLGQGLLAMIAAYEQQTGETVATLDQIHGR